MNDFDVVDFVLPWVDGSDQKWIEDYNKWAFEAKKPGADSRTERFRDYGLLKYVFRGIEKFTPWVRTVHFVTNGQKPEWLNLSCSKLHFVRHEDYISKQYLPVFSSHPIELCMHKISGLAEKFVYLNDDFFFIAPIPKSFFFNKGLPCDYTGFTTLGISSTKIPHILLNDYIEINKHFSRRDVLKSHFFKWYNLMNGPNLVKTLCTSPFRRIDGIIARHFPQPYTKSCLEDVWNNCSDVLNETVSHRFRNQLTDVNQWLFRFWQLCEGNFYPVNHKREERMINLSEWSKADSQAIKNHKYKEICINDDTGEKACPDYEQKMKEIQNAFESILSEKSSFEL